MTAEVEERPRLVTGGYRQHRSQWVKKAQNLGKKPLSMHVYTTENFRLTIQSVRIL